MTSQGAYWRELQQMEAMVAEERARVAQGAKQGGSHLRPGCSGSSTPKTMRKPVREGIPPHNADRSTNHAARPDESTLAAEAADLPQEGASEAVGSEQAVKIASGNPAVGRLRALGAAVGQDQAGPRARSAPSVRPMWIS